jgi:hypothetical protein
MTGVIFVEVTDMGPHGGDHRVFCQHQLAIGLNKATSWYSPPVDITYLLGVIFLCVYISFHKGCPTGRQVGGVFPGGGEDTGGVN